MWDRSVLHAMQDESIRQKWGVRLIPMAWSSGHLASADITGSSEHQGRKRKASPCRHGHGTAAHGVLRRCSQHGVVVLKGVRRERIGRGGVGTDIESPLHSFLTPLHHQLIPFDPIEASTHRWARQNFKSCHRPHAAMVTVRGAVARLAWIHLRTKFGTSSCESQEHYDWNNMCIVTSRFHLHLPSHFL